MTQHARLITPRGKRIDLSPEMYRRIKRLINATPKQRRSLQAHKAIATTYGKYAVTRSLTRALLDERAADRERENRKMRRARG